MGEAIKKVRSGYATYPDYEDADQDQVASMERTVMKFGGVVRRTVANEDEGQALVSFAGIPNEKADAFKADAEDNGWEIEWRS